MERNLTPIQDATRNKLLKQRLWDGYFYDEIGAEFGLNSSFISRVVNGYYLRDVPWPDGSYGSLNEARKRQIKSDRKKKSRLVQGVRTEKLERART